MIGALVEVTSSPWTSMLGIAADSVTGALVVGISCCDSNLNMNENHPLLYKIVKYNISNKKQI